MKGKALLFYNLGILIIAIGAVGLIVLQQNAGVRISAICTGVGMVVCSIALIVDRERHRRQNSDIKG
jgi:hypothetical protein